MVCCLPTCAKGSFVPGTIEGWFWYFGCFGARGSLNVRMPLLKQGCVGMLGAGQALRTELGAGISHATFREFNEFFKHGFVLMTVFDSRVRYPRLLHVPASKLLPSPSGYFSYFVNWVKGALAALWWNGPLAILRQRCPTST